MMFSKELLTANLLKITFEVLKLTLMEQLEVWLKQLTQQLRVKCLSKQILIGLMQNSYNLTSFKTFPMSIHYHTTLQKLSIRLEF